MSAEPGLTDSEEYAALYALVVGAGDRSVMPRRSLAAAAAYREASEQLVRRLVADARRPTDGRRRPVPWSVIGPLLGVSAQAAWRRYGVGL